MFALEHDFSLDCQVLIKSELFDNLSSCVENFEALSPA